MTLQMLALCAAIQASVLAVHGGRPLPPLASVAFGTAARASAGASALHARWTEGAGEPRGAPRSVDLARERGLVEEARAAVEAGDLGSARLKADTAIQLLLARPASERDEGWVELLDAAGRFAWHAGDVSAARTAWEAVLDVRSKALPDDHPDLQTARQSLAAALTEQGDLHGARALEEQVLAVLARTLPEDDPMLQAARGNLAWTIKALGDLQRARELEEQVLAVFSRTLPDDHPDLQLARQNMAVTLHELGDLSGAGELFARVLDVYSRVLPDEHPDVVAVRRNLAATLAKLGELDEARELFERVLDVLSRVLPDEHEDIQAARWDLIGALKRLGDLRNSRVIEEQVLEVYSRTLPEGHPDLQNARRHLAATLHGLGDLRGTRALEERVLEVYSRALPEEDPDVLTARQNLATTLADLGDLYGARALAEQVLAVRSRTLPEEHPDLQAARGNLALTMKALGDMQGARALEEQVLAVRSRTLPEGHPDLQSARGNLASTIKTLGDLQGARALEEHVLAILSRTVSEEHPDLQAARQNLAGTLKQQGDFQGARALEEQVLAARSRTLPEEHPYLQMARGNLAATMYQQGGDLHGARTLTEQVLEVRLRTLPEEHPDLQSVRMNLARIIARQAASASSTASGEPVREREREQCAELLGAMLRSHARMAREAVLTVSRREAEERCAHLSESLGLALSFTAGNGAFEPMPELLDGSFALSESTRGAPLAASALAHVASRSERLAASRAVLRESADELAALAQKGATSGELQSALARRDALERELVASVRESLGERGASLEPDAAVVASVLESDEAVVGYRCYRRENIGVVEDPAGSEPAKSVVEVVDSLCAFVVRPAADAGEAPLVFVDLGPLHPIQAAVSAWRDAVGVGLEGAGGERGLHADADPERDVATRRLGAERQRGEELRRLVLDPVLSATGDVERLIVVLEDVLHLVPIDSLPTTQVGDASPTAALVGERLRIEVRSTTVELLEKASASPASGALLALGGASFDEAPLGPNDLDPVTEGSDGSTPQVAAILRGGAWERGFTPLAFTRSEARELADLHADVFDSEPTLVLDRRRASRESLEAHAPRARWLHVATHGWYAAESIRSWQDPEPLDLHTGLGVRQSGEEQIRGMSPMLLCGLALAGANLPEDALGRVPGLVTAEELATLDLTGCDLAVLSACDTNVGQRRAGQGVASLQRALQMAGARSVITSLWKVPDEATRALMLDFYRRLWVERKPKHRALWEAKMHLRDARARGGESAYTTRDWAAWVLTGEQE